MHCKTTYNASGQIEPDMDRHRDVADMYVMNSKINTLLSLCSL